MEDTSFKSLVEPVNMLVGYCRSAEALSKEADLRKWGNRLMELAECLAKAWDKEIKNV